MRRQGLTGYSCAFLMLCSSSANVWAYSGGSGAAEDPYQIANKTDLLELAGTFADCNKHFILVNDIDLAGEVFTAAIIAPHRQTAGPGPDGTGFSGTFNGNAHRIRNLTIDTGNAEGEYLGLFGTVEPNSVIQDLGVEDCSITAGQDSHHVGALVGYGNANVYRCYSTGRIVVGSSSSLIGGLVGYSFLSGQLMNCYSDVDIRLGDQCGFAGGLVGANYGDIVMCYASGAIVGQGTSLGGLLGYHSPELGVGVFLSFWDVNRTGTETSGGGFGRTTKQMQAAATYTGWTGGTWTIDEGKGYPHLAWENQSGVSIDYQGPPRSYRGLGTEDDPFLLAGADDFTCLSQRPEDWGDHFCLAHDIDMSAIHDYMPPGDFPGMIDGRGFTVTGLRISKPPSSVGLVGRLGETGSIRSLHLQNVRIDAQGAAGGIAGISCGTIINCDVTGEINAGEAGQCLGGLVGLNGGTIEGCSTVISITSGKSSEYLGGLIGNHSGNGTVSNSHAVVTIVAEENSRFLGGLVGANASGAQISDCYASGSVTGGDNMLNAGGLVGWNYSAEVHSCHADVHVSGGARCGDVAGLVGNNQYDSLVENSYATGSVTTGPNGRMVGGLVGYMARGGTKSHDESVCARIVNCFATGLVSAGVGSTEVGGLLGANYRGRVVNSFWDIETTGQGTSWGGFGRTTASMQQGATYAGWGGVWMMDEGKDYPRLAWQGLSGMVLNNIPPRSYRGSGVQNDPFVLATATDVVCLTARQEDWSSSFVLSNDIDMSAVSNYLPPGDFNGVIDGRGHVIRGLTVHENTSRLGFLGCLSAGGEVRNLAVVDVDIQGIDYLGGLVGLTLFSRVSNVSATGTVTAEIASIPGTGLAGAGGLVGYSVGANIQTSFAAINMVGRDGHVSIGGLIGSNFSGSVSDCYSWGIVSAGRNASQIAGLIGSIRSEATVCNCYSTGSVLAGEGSTNVGGLIGVSDASTVANSFFLNSGEGGGPNNGLGTAQSATQMKDKQTFLAAGWDFVGETANGTADIWRWQEGNYPEFAWQLQPGPIFLTEGLENDFCDLAWFPQ